MSDVQTFSLRIKTIDRRKLAICAALRGYSSAGEYLRALAKADTEVVLSKLDPDLITKMLEHPETPEHPLAGMPFGAPKPRTKSDG